MPEYLKHITGLRSEAAYFEDRDERLRAKLRSDLEAQARERNVREALATELHSDARAVIDALRLIGIDTETAPVLPLLPLVYVAWADGSVAAAERLEILADAPGLGVHPGSSAFGYLLTLLEKRPAPELLSTLLDAVVLLIRHHGGRPKHVVDCCLQVAAVAGGVWGVGSISVSERLVLDRIINRLAPDTQRHLTDILDA